MREHSNWTTQAGLVTSRGQEQTGDHHQHVTPATVFVNHFASGVHNMPMSDGSHARPPLFPEPRAAPGGFILGKREAISESPPVTFSLTESRASTTILVPGKPAMVTPLKLNGLRENPARFKPAHFLSNVERPEARI
ncbi:MAG: hypothetical protein V6Z86_02685 [Hyphomicrobiales bacterium]